MVVGLLFDLFSRPAVNLFMIANVERFQLRVMMLDETNAFSNVTSSRLPISLFTWGARYGHGHLLYRRLAWIRALSLLASHCSASRFSRLRDRNTYVD